MTIRLLAAIAACLVLQLHSVATAQEADERTEEARTLFQEGLGLAQEERFEEAAVRFRRAYLLRASPAIAFNFGNALVRSGRLVEGTEILRQVTRNSDAPRNLRRQAEAIIEEAEPRIGRLVVHVEGEPEGTTIAIHGSPIDVASFGVPISADPGTNEVTATRDEEVVASATVEVPEGGEAEVSIEVPPPPPPVEQPDEPPPILPVEPDPTVDEEGGVASKWWFWTLIGVAIAGGALAAVLIATSGGTEDPIVGTTQPGVLTWD